MAWSRTRTCLFKADRDSKKAGPELDEFRPFCFRAELMKIDQQDLD